MRYSIDDLRAAAAAGAINSSQLEALLAFLGTPQPGPSTSAPKFDVVHLLWYMGALVVISAMGLFSTLAFTKMGGPALAATALVYVALFTAAGHYLWTVRKLRTPGGLLIAIAVSMIPLAVYGVQDSYGAWSQFGKPGTVRDFYVWIKGSWIFNGASDHRRRPDRAAVLPLSLNCLHHGLCVVVPVDGHCAVDHRIAGRQLGNLAPCFDRLRPCRHRRGHGCQHAAAFRRFRVLLYLFGVMTFWGGITDGSSVSNVTRCCTAP